MQRLVTMLLSLFVFLIPWQARWVLRAGELNGGFWEYGTISVFATDVLFVLILLAAAVWLLRDKDMTITIPSKKFVLVLGVFLLWVAASIGWAGDTTSAVFACIKFLEGVILFFLVSALPVNRRMIIVAFVASGVVESTLAIVQWTTQSVSAFAWSGIAPKLPNELGPAVVEIASGRFLRAYGSFPHPNLFGGFVALALIVFLQSMSSLRGCGNRRSNLRNREIAASPSAPRNDSEKKVSAWSNVTSHLSPVIILCTLFTGLLLSFSRASWIAFLVGAMWWAVAHRAWRDRATRRGAALFIIVAGLLVWHFLPLITQRVEGQGRLEQQSVHERTDQYGEALALGRAHPWLGVGIGQYTGALHEEIRADDPAWSYQPVHNHFALLGVELGLIGLVFFLLLALAYLQSIPRAARAPVAGLTALLFLDHSYITLHSGILLFWCVLAWTLWQPSSEKADS